MTTNNETPWVPADFVSLAEALSIPIAAMIVLVIALMFRESLISLLNRTKKLSSSGLETYEQSPSQLKSERTGIEEFRRSFDNPIMARFEASIQKDLEDRKIAVNDREEALIRSLALNQIIMRFEAIHRVIWASQLECLVAMNMHESGVPDAFIRNLFSRFEERYSDAFADRDFDSWLRFLFDAEMIEEKDGAVHITEFGREYLKFIIAARKAPPAIQ